MSLFHVPLDGLSPERRGQDIACEEHQPRRVAQGLVVCVGGAILCGAPEPRAVDRPRRCKPRRGSALAWEVQPHGQIRRRKPKGRAAEGRGGRGLTRKAVELWKFAFSSPLRTGSSFFSSRSRRESPPNLPLAKGETFGAVPVLRAETLPGVHAHVQRHCHCAILDGEGAALIRGFLETGL
jgi:hypothetical protein